MAKPLAGIRVLDLTNVLAGPFCCHQLAQLGADVIKIEAPGRGDLARSLGADPALNAGLMGVSFLAQNAGKRSVTANLKHPKGKALFLELVDRADVVVENFRPGVMDRLGLGPEQLRQHRPTLIYAAISGFGQTGPWADWPAYDQIVQGASGAMAITGDDDSGPLRAGFPVADSVGGLTAAFAIAAALNAQPRGSVIDVSMLTSLLATMGWAVSNTLIAGMAPEPMGNENPTSAPSGTFATATGPINIAANRDAQWVVLTDHLGLAALRTDPRFVDREARKRNRIALRTALETVLVTRPAETWIQALTAIGVPAGPILTVPDILGEAQVAERGFVQNFAQVPGVGRGIAVATSGIQLDGQPTGVAAPPPTLGQHNADIWRELGIEADLDALQAEGAI